MARSSAGLHFAISLPFLALASPVFAEPPLPERVAVADGVMLTTHKEYYTIRAGTRREVSLEVVRKGPKQLFAYTDWKIGLNFPHAQVASGCATGPVRISLSVTYTLPRLELEAPVEAGLEQYWSKFLRHLLLHEAGHRDLGALAANEVRELLSSASPEPTCQALDAKVRAGANEIIGRYKNLEQEYDARSFKGERQLGKSFDAVLGLRIPSLLEDGGGQRRALE